MSFHAFQKMSAATAEATTTVDRDREFDQTAKTVTEPRHVSPAIHEHRINVLEQEKRDLTDALDRETVAHGKTQHELNAANARIKQFEDFTRTLAAKCDQMIERCEDLGVDILDLPPAVEMPPEMNLCTNLSCELTFIHAGPCKLPQIEPPAVETVTATDRAQIETPPAVDDLPEGALGVGDRLPRIETPPAVETHADGVRETPSNPCNQVSPIGPGRCIKARYHLGPCMTGAAA